MKSHMANLLTFLKNRSNEICTNEIRIRREPSVGQIYGGDFAICGLLRITSDSKKTWDNPQ